jgi:3'-phosphoadenosine 5'-phosphosulfate sulfotransferase (PAPS reductase)/FAD synthetase
MKPQSSPLPIFHIGISGGKDSTAVLLWMVHESGISRDRLDVTFCDTENEHQFTYDQIRLINERIHPVKTLTPPRGFFELARWKQRFPSSQARFCTEHLKIKVTAEHLSELLRVHRTVVAVSGVRADESSQRADYLEWDYSGRLFALQWRPLIRWTLADVLAIHDKYEIPLNPLYAMGATRVGCWPCIMSRKSEIRMIALKFPERIDKIREQEAEIGSTFFPPNTVPKRFRSKRVWSKRRGEEVGVPTIDDVVRWSMTGDRAVGNYSDNRETESRCMSGFCE